MIINKKLQAIRDKFANSEAKLVADLKYDFITEINKKRSALGISFGQLAEKIKVSKPYMTKIMRGESNFTIESMVKLAKATDSRVVISVVDNSKFVINDAWIQSYKQKNTTASQQTAITGADLVVLHNNSSNIALTANDNSYSGIAA